MKRQIGQRRLLAELVLAGMLIGGAQAQDQVDLGTVQNDASDINGSASNAGSQSAPAQAPSQASLSETEPASIISRHYIENNTGPGSNYTDLISIAPSVFNVDPNGNGLMESQGLSIRGFQDGQYNVTFDGIPMGDSNDFTHHSTTYFMAQDLGSVTVDRGPGSAATIGDATFGGTIDSKTKDPSAVSGISPYMSAGSFNTKLFGAELDTGTMHNWGDGSAYLDVKQITSDGWDQNAHQRRSNAMFKLLRPVGDNTVISLMSMVDQLDQNPPFGATMTQMQNYGQNFSGISNYPGSQTFSGYNRDVINSDISYLGLNTVQGTWTVDEKLYTYAYRHHGYNGSDNTQPVVTQESNLGTLWNSNDVPGQAMTMQYRSVGDTLRASDHLKSGDLNVGIWYDHQYNTRSQYEVDYTLGGALNPQSGTIANPNYQSAIDRLMSDTLDTLQPYAEFAWKATDDLTVRPGIKYVRFTRHINAPIDQGTKQSLDFGHTWAKALPSLDIHYNLNQNWTSYVQAAEGFLAPNLNTFYTSIPGSSDVQPQNTWNYQWGTVFKTSRFTGDIDVYYIRFTNEILSTYAPGQPHNSLYKVFYNATGASIYKGVEAEGTYYMDFGMSIYANASVNSAHNDSSTYVQGNGTSWLPNTPLHTAAVGLIYDQNGIYASLTDKYVGPNYAGQGGQLYANSPNIMDYQFGGFSVTSLSTSYSFGKDRATKLGLQVDNLFNHSGLYQTNGTGGTSGNEFVFYAIPGRAITASLSTKI